MTKSFVYIVRCSDKTLYTGWTTDVTKRIALHTAGKGAKYTRSRTPVTLVYSEKCASPVQAQRREREIKKLSHAQKNALFKTKKVRKKRG